MNHSVGGGIENMLGSRHSVGMGLMAGWTMGLRDNHELWDTDFFKKENTEIMSLNECRSFTIAPRETKNLIQ